MKITGNLIELDPTKEYIFIVDDSKIILKDLQKCCVRSGAIIRAYDMSGFKIIQHTGNIVGFVQKFKKGVRKGEEEK